MAYNDFDLKNAIRIFNLTEADSVALFPVIDPIEPNPYLVEWLDEFGPITLGVNTEKARSETIITPILAEAKRRAGVQANVFSGIVFDVDRSNGLSGYCDFLIARSDKLYYVESPIIAVVEAKKEDIIAGLGQCAVEMVAIRIFNEREQSAIPIIYGCVTSGTNWRFLKLEGSKLTIDSVEYYLRELPKLLGILVRIIRG
jgi:hypothetical protein